MYTKSPKLKSKFYKFSMEITYIFQFYQVKFEIMIERNYKRERNKNCIVPDEISFKMNIEKSERKGY